MLRSTRGLQAMERRIQRPGFNLEKIFRSSLDLLRDRMPVRGSEAAVCEESGVERALEQLQAGRARRLIV